MNSDPDTRTTFTLRFSTETLEQLHDLTQRGLFESYEMAVEAAVDGLYAQHTETPEEEYRRKQQAFERSCGVLNLGIGREELEAAELERDEYDYQRNTGRP